MKHKTQNCGCNLQLVAFSAPNSLHFLRQDFARTAIEIQMPLIKSSSRLLLAVLFLGGACPAEALIAEGNSMGHVAVGGLLLALFVACLCCCCAPLQLLNLRGVRRQHSDDPQQAAEDFKGSKRTKYALLTTSILLVALTTSCIAIWTGLGLDGRLTYLEQGAARGEPRSFYDILYDSAAANNTHATYQDWLAAGGQQEASDRGYHDIYAVETMHPAATKVYGRETRWDLWLLLAWNVLAALVFWSILAAWALAWRAAGAGTLQVLPRASGAGRSAGGI